MSRNRSTAGVGHQVELGARRGWLEFRQSLTNKQDAFNYFALSALFLGLAWMLRDSGAPGGISVGAIFLAGVIGFTVSMGGIVTVGQVLAAEREDGTLLRAKAIPGGMSVYLIAKAFHVLLVTLVNTLIVLLPSSLVIADVRVRDATSVGLLVWFVALGLAATVPIGAVIGSLLKNPRTSMGILMLPIMGISMVSGIFVPITSMPGWGQTIAQVFPMYWVGLGTRSALLPDTALAAEIAGSWRFLEASAVLGVWAVVGFAVAPVVLRRVARRESGSRVAAARERMLSEAV